MAVLDGAVDLVGRDLEVATGSAAGARRADRLEQDVDADDAGPDERLRVEDRAVDVRLGGEVHDGVGVGDERADDVAVGDVALDEAERAPLGPSPRPRRGSPRCRRTSACRDRDRVPSSRARTSRT
jgi:hypothetical protein